MRFYEDVVRRLSGDVPEEQQRLREYVRTRFDGLRAE